MKNTKIFFFFSCLFCQFVYAQIGMEKKEPCWYKGARRDTLRYVDFECGKLLGVVDCNDKLTFDEENNVFYANGSGNPYSGDCETCHNNGLREHLIHFVNGKEDGVDTTYYRSGCIMVVRSLSLGIENGRWTYYFDSTARPSWIKTYANGKLDGEQLDFNEFGDTTKWEHYTNGVVNGVKRTYYLGTKLKEEVNYKNGIFNGDFLTYFESGKPSKKLHFTNGQKDGKLEYFYDNGNLLKVENYTKGVKNGEFTSFYINGAILSQEFYEKGKKQGKFIEKYANGRLMSEYIYEDDVLLEYRKYDSFGRLTEGTPEKPSGMEDDAMPTKNKSTNKTVKKAPEQTKDETPQTPNNSHTKATKEKQKKEKQKKEKPVKPIKNKKDKKHA